MFSLTSYFSVEYLVVLLPLSVGLYAVLPQKLRRVSLLLSSYVFFWAVSGKLIAYLLFSTLSIHHIGLWLSSIQRDCDSLVAASPKEKRKEIKAQYLKKQRFVVAFAVMVHIGILLVLKYTPFFAGNLNTLFQVFRIPVTLAIPSFVLPIGISFYTMQAVAYIFDVYRRKIPADLIRAAPEAESRVHFPGYLPVLWLAVSKVSVFIPLRPEKRAEKWHPIEHGLLDSLREDNLSVLL